MAKSLKKYMNVDVVAFLEEKMRGNTKYYQSDFEYDKEKFARFVGSEHKEDKTLLWLSRSHGTQCIREYEAFLEGTGAYHTWQYYADQESGGKYVAFAVELKGVQDGVIRGDVYELDYAKHAEMVKKNSQPAYEAVYTFEDGFESQASFKQSSGAYWGPVVEKHGAIVESRAIPTDKDLLGLVLAEQKSARDKMKEATFEPKSLVDVLKDAQERVSAGTAVDCKEQEFGIG